MDTNKMERLTMTIGEVAAALGISRATAYMLANTGGLPVIRLGERRMVVSRRAIEKLLEQAGTPARQD
jgi:excisionase family DNA binding protein